MQKFPNYQELFRELFDVFLSQKFPIVTINPFSLFIMLTSRNFRPKNLALQIIIPDYL